MVTTKLLKYLNVEFTVIERVDLDLMCALSITEPFVREKQITGVEHSKHEYSQGSCSLFQ